MTQLLKVDCVLFDITCAKEFKQAQTIITYIFKTGKYLPQMLSPFGIQNQRIPGVQGIQLLRWGFLEEVESSTIMQFDALEPVMNFRGDGQWF